MLSAPDHTARAGTTWSVDNRVPYGIVDALASTRRELSTIEKFNACRILFVENGFFLDEDTAKALHQLGAELVRIEGDLLLANFEAPGQFDAAIIDVTLDPVKSFELIQRLDARQTPYVFATTDCDSARPWRFRPFRLCPDLRELELIANGLFGDSDSDQSPL